MKKNKRSKSWIINQHRDQYFKKSKILGYRSRSAFKLIEINKKFKLLNNNTNLIDLGSAPGGWSQVASQIITKGLIIAIDTKEMKNLSFQIRSENNNLVMLLAAENKGKSTLTIMLTDDLLEKGLDARILIKEVSKEISGSGGGQPFFATAGGSSKGIENALNKFRELINS